MKNVIREINKKIRFQRNGSDKKTLCFSNEDEMNHISITVFLYFDDEQAEILEAVIEYLSPDEYKKIDLKGDVKNKLKDTVLSLLD